MGKQKFQKNGASRAAVKQKNKKKGIGGKLVLAVVTCVNLLLSVLLHLLRRQEILHAVSEDDQVRVLLETKPKTKEKA